MQPLCLVADFFGIVELGIAAGDLFALRVPTRSPDSESEGLGAPGLV